MVDDQALEAAVSEVVADADVVESHMGISIA